ncbi:MAG: sterol desaturase family protein [Pseudomonadota bacterium]
MNWLFDSITEGTLYNWELALGDSFFLISIAILAVELIRYAVRKRLNWRLAGDTVTNFVTQAFFVSLGLVLFYAFYLATFSVAAGFALFEIPVNGMTLVAAVLLADFMYYWEHRFSHRVAAAWATHTVHHSSPHFNMSVAYRFGPMDAFWSVFFYVPLVLIGFNPYLVLFAEAIVLLYQTFLHTEIVGKLPPPIEWLMNTPSHHRVHHGTNKPYVDKNYGGVFIVWDRLFGTFAEETETVEFGVSPQVESVNPFVVFFHGIARLWRAVRAEPRFADKLRVLVKPPGWKPERQAPVIASPHSGRGSLTAARGAPSSRGA